MDHKIHPLTNELPRWVAILLVIIVIARVCILAYTIDVQSLSGRHYFVRQSIYTFAFGSMALWFIYYFLHANDLLPENMNLEKISLLAMGACVLKSVTTIVNFFEIDLHNLYMVGYYSLEVIVWIVLALFFWGYSRHQHRIFANR